MKLKNLLSISLFILMTLPMNAQKKASIKRKKLFVKNEEIQPTLFWAQYDATKRGSMIYVDKNSKVRILSENPPDGAYENLITISSKLAGIKGIDATVAFEAQKSIAELGKRTAAVNMLRDALYRLNELYYATTDEKEKITKQIIDGNILPHFNSNNNLFLETMITPTLETNDIKTLFSEIIISAKEIAIEEAKIDIEKQISETTRAKADTEKYKILKELLDTFKGKIDERQIDEILSKI